MRPGAYDVHERVRDMDRNGVLATMCFPSFPGFSAGPSRRRATRPAMIMTQAYNDWHIDEWAPSYPGRFIPLAHTAHLGPAGPGGRDPARGQEGLPGRDHARAAPVPGLPSYQRPRITGIPSSRPVRGHVVMRPHIGAGASGGPSTRPDAPIDNLITLGPHVHHLAAARISSGVPGPAELPGPQGGVVRGGNRVDPVLPRPL